MKQHTTKQHKKSQMLKWAQASSLTSKPNDLTMFYFQQKLQKTMAFQQKQAIEMLMSKKWWHHNIRFQRKKQDALTPQDDNRKKSDSALRRWRS